MLEWTDGWRLIFLQYSFFGLFKEHNFDFFLYLIFVGRNGDFEDYAIFEGDFEQFIMDNTPLVFMNPNADPFICGNNGGPISKCGHYVSEYAENWRTYKP